MAVDNVEACTVKLALLTEIFFSLDSVGEGLAACAVDEDYKNILVAFCCALLEFFFKAELCNS